MTDPDAPSKRTPTAEFSVEQRVWLLERDSQELRREFNELKLTVMQRFDKLDAQSRSNSRWAIGILCSILLVVVPLLLSVLGEIGG